MNSNALFAEEFQDMVYETILTNTWKYGSYQVENQLAEEAEKVAEEERLQRLLSEIEARQN
jgi:hypothetical protein